MVNDEFHHTSLRTRIGPLVGHASLSFQWPCCTCHVPNAVGELLTPTCAMVKTVDYLLILEDGHPIMSRMVIQQQLHFIRFVIYNFITDIYVLSSNQG